MQNMTNSATHSYRNSNRGGFNFSEQDKEGVIEGVGFWLALEGRIGFG